MASTQVGIILDNVASLGDVFFLLYLTNRAAPVWGRTKVQKTVFLAELRLREAGLVGPHFTFRRWEKGPFSTDLWDAMDDLRARGFLSHYHPTSRGQFLIDLAEPELRAIPENQQVFEVADRVAKQCRPKSGAQLIRDVYRIRMTPEGWEEKRAIREIPMNVKLLFPPTDRGIVIPYDLAEIISSDLKLTDEQLAEARAKVPEIERDFLRRLTAAA